MSSVFDKMTDAEKEVAEFLRELGLYWQYEFPLFVYDKKDRPRVWTPDFRIPSLGIHIEVCGADRWDYEYRYDIFDRNKCNVIFLHKYKEDKEWKSYLIKRLVQITENREYKLKNILTHPSVKNLNYRD